VTQTKGLWRRTLGWVIDHKGLVGALGIALVTVGLGGYVSLRVGHSISGHPLHDAGHVADLCLTTMWVGVALLGLVIVSAVDRFYARLALSKLFAEGMRLKTEVRKLPVDMDDVTQKDISSRVDDWEKRAAASVAKRWPVESLMHWHNEEAKLLTSTASLGHYPLKAWYEVEIDTRLARLVEIARGR